MGAWGMEPFENDSALDFTGHLFDGELGDLTSLNQVFAEVIEANEQGYIDSDQAEPAIAAAALLSYLKQGQSAQAVFKIQPEGIAWFNQALQADYTTLFPAALKALALISTETEKSEAYQLWADADNLDDWLNSVKQIQLVLTT